MDFSLGFIEFDRSLFCYLFDITQYNNFSCIEWTMFSIQQKTFCSTVHQIDIGIWRGNNKISILTFFFCININVIVLQKLELNVCCENA